MEANQKNHFLELLFATLLISTSGVLGKYIALDPPVIIWCRSFLAVIVLYFYCRHQKLNRAILSRKDLGVSSKSASSSIAALGSDTTSDSIDESTPWNADQDHTPYAYSKFGAELEVWRATQEGVPAVIVNPGVILGNGVQGNPLELLCKQVDKHLPFYPKGATGYVTVEDVVQVLTDLMDSETKNERFILVAENWSYEQMLRRIALIRKKRPPRIALRKSWLQVAWGLEGILSLFGKRRFMTKALISSLCDVKHIQGNRILQETAFRYSDIETYLTDHAMKKD